MADSLHRYRIGYVSENRKEEGLILSASVTTNLTITVWNRLRSSGPADPQAGAGDGAGGEDDPGTGHQDAPVPPRR